MDIVPDSLSCLAFATNHALELSNPSDLQLESLADLLEFGAEVEALSLGSEIYYSPTLHPSDAALIRLLSGVGELGCLTRLSLCHIETPGSLALPIGLVSVLERNGSIDYLALRYNAYDPAGALIIAGGLSKRKSCLREFALTAPKLTLPESRTLSVALFESRVSQIELKICNLHDEEASIIASALGKNRTVTSLALNFNSISAAGGKALAEVLARKNNTLMRLNLGNNEIGFDGAKAMGEMLAVNTSLAVLWLKHNKIDMAGSRCVMEGIIRNGSSGLRELHLGGNYEHNKRYVILAKAMLKRDATLALEDPIQGVADAKAIVAVTRRNRAITQVCLNMSRIGDEEARILAEGLLSPKATAVVFLAVTKGEVGDAGATAFARALESAATILRELHLECNNIGDRGAKSLAKALKSNRSLVKLDLSGNKIGNEGAERLVQAADKENSTLSDLVLELNNISGRGTVVPPRPSLRIQY